MPSIREKYAEEIDFSVLALQSPSFAKYLKPNGQLNFSDPKAVQELTKSLLKRDFKLDIDLPDDRLCPPVPNRLNYIFWLQDLLDSCRDDPEDAEEAGQEAIGLDIGTGASCIYPLLGCVLRPAWKFAGTDTDETSFQYATTNVARNNLKSRIRLLKTTPDGPLVPLDSLRIHRLDFTMCNPPFYSSKEELLALAAQKSRPPFSACTGSASEMITPGGELAFALRLLSESLHLRRRVRWYTIMFGKLSSVLSFIPKLKEGGVTNWAVTEFVQGVRTRRWGVGWSFTGRRPRMAIARGVASLPKSLLPFPSEYLIRVSAPLDGENGAKQVGAQIHRVLSSLEGLSWDWRPGISMGIGYADENLWSRSSRRRGQKTEGARDVKMQDSSGDDEEEDGDDDEDEENAIRFKIHVARAEKGEGDAGNVEVHIRWVEGQDHVLFESFCGMLKRKIPSS